MRRYLIYIAIAFILIIAPKGVFALCDKRVLTDYRNLASNIKTTTSYQLINGKPKFSVTLYNLYEGMYIVDETDPERPKKYTASSFDTSTELTLTGFTENQRLIFKVYIQTNSCSNEPLTTKYVTLPNYNEFSEDPICKGLEGFTLCQRWASTSVTQEQFLERVKEYRSKKTVKLTSHPEEQELSFKDRLVRFVGQYYIYLVAGVIILILILAVLQSVFAKKNEFDFRV